MQNNPQNDKIYTLITNLAAAYMVVLFAAIVCLCLSSCPH